MPKGIPLTEDDQIRRRREIFDAAVHLFLEKGFQETSMREIAEAAGVGKSTLYDYFKTKDDILLSVFVEQVEAIFQKAREIDVAGGSAEVKLRSIMHMHMDFLLAKMQLNLKLSNEIQRLRLESQERIQASRYAYQDFLGNLIEEGIQNGEFRPVNTRLAARSLINLLATAIYTSRPVRLNRGNGQ